MSKWKHTFPLIFAAVFSLFPGAFIFFEDPKSGVMWMAFVFLFTLYVFVKKRIDMFLIIAMLFALFTNLANDYTYTTVNFMLFGVNFFSFVSWTAGLITLREVYDYLGFRFKWLALSFVYLVLLLFAEYVAFHHFNIQLDNDYPSLLGLGVIHGPPLMHFFYPLAGPVYLLVTDLVLKWFDTN